MFDADDIIPIPLRPDLVVRIGGLPRDLTPALALCIAVVSALFAQSEGQVK